MSQVRPAIGNMATVTYKTDRSSLKQCLTWIQGVSATITNIISPLTDTFTRTTEPTEPAVCGTRKRIVSFHPSTSPASLIYPRIEVPASSPYLYRRKSSPPMPLGEHNAAARNRLRAKTERRSSRRRRQTLANSQRLSSSAPSESTQHETTQQDHFQVQTSTSPTSSRRCPSIPAPFENNTCEECLQQIPTIDTASGHGAETKVRKKPPPPLKSSSTLDMPVKEMFEQFLSTEKTNIRHSQLSRRRAKNLLDALLISPKTVFPNPTSGLVTHHHATAFTNSIPVSRKKKDLSSPPVSSAYYLWHLFVDGRGPILFSAVDGRRGSGWTIDTPNLGKTGLHKCRESVNGVYHPELHGKRKYNRESGFWAWTSALTGVPSRGRYENKLIFR